MILGVLVLITLERFPCNGIPISQNGDLDFVSSGKQMNLEENNDRKMQLLLDYHDYVDSEGFENPEPKLDLFQPLINDGTRIVSNGKGRQFGVGVNFLSEPDESFYSEYSLTSDKDALFQLNSPLIENVYSAIDINLEPHSNIPLQNKDIQSNKKLELIDILNNIRSIEAYKKSNTPMEHFGGLVGNNDRTESRIENTIDVGHDTQKLISNKKKRFVISFSVPPFKYRRRRKIKGKRIRRILRNRPFKIDPTYFLLGIGK
ncbi:uncharacterized protein LOC134709204 [Mytilus trossulus]|uniref:uncharacterized protein LOC134709204 n=1 Tax=Mytilus trossulus TaxID=6551 RepID=UPI003004D6D5